MRWCTLKIRPKMNISLTKHSCRVSLLYSNSMCEILKARHSIYKRECLGEQDRRVWLSFVRNLLEGRSKKPRWTCHERWAWYKPKLISTPYSNTKHTLLKLLSTPYSRLFFYFSPLKWAQFILQKLILWKD